MGAKITIFFSLLVSFCSGVAQGQSSAAITAKKVGPGESIFVENRGQWDTSARFLLRCPGVSEWITGDGAVFDFRSANTQKNLKVFKNLQVGRLVGHVVKMSFLGARSTAATGEGQLQGKYNFFIGNTQSKWRTNVPGFSAVRFEQPYDGISVRYYLDQGSLRYDVIVKPGADPSQVRMKFEGANGVRVLQNGDLAIETSVGTIEQKGLAAYQEEGNSKRLVPCRMVSDGSSVSFDTGGFDPTKALIIDPLIFSTFTGGTNNFDEVNGVKSAPGGAPIIAGATGATDFPTTTGAYDRTYAGALQGFVAEYNATGTQAIYSTFLGGSQSTEALGLAVDTAGEAVVVGRTSSADYPVTQGSLQTVDSNPDNQVAFVTKLNAAGNGLVFSTYLAGTDSGFRNGSQANAVALDGYQNVFVAGSNGDNNFPVSANAYQSQPKGPWSGFLVKLNASGGKLLYGTLIGGSDYDWGTAVAVDKNDQAYLAGWTESSDFPTTAGAYQATDPAGSSQVSAGFVTKFNSDASSLAYSTYIGGSNWTNLNALAVNSTNCAIVAGYTLAQDYPTTAGVLQPTYPNFGPDGVITELNSSGSELTASTYFGDTQGQGFINGLTLDTGGNVVICGQASSNDFPTTARAFQINNKYGGGPFLASINPAMNNENYCTFIAGSNGGGENFAQCVALTPAGNALIAGLAWSADFPTTPNAWDSVGSGDGSAFVACIKMTAQIETGLLDFAVPTPVMSGATVALTAHLNGPASQAQNISLSASQGMSVPAGIVIPAGENFGVTEVTVPTVSAPTQYTISATLRSVSLERTINVVPPAITIQAPDAMLQNFNGYQFVVRLSGFTGMNGPKQMKIATTGALSINYAGAIVSDGETSVDLSIATTSVSEPTASHITVTLGALSATKIVNVYPGLKSFRIGPAAGVGGGTFTGHIQLYFASSFNMEVAIQHIDSQLNLETYNIEIPAGSVSYDFPIKTTPVTVATPASMTMEGFGTTLTSVVILNP